ncbi:MAG: hypothetical protein ACYSW8_21560 [Planctomycetota bacterium]|jgi:hypothetical protein
MKKYVIQTQTIGIDGNRTPSAFVEPGIHRPLYQTEPMQKAIQFLRDVPEAEGVWVRVESRAFAITVYEGDRPLFDDYAFPLEEADDGAKDSD